MKGEGGKCLNWQRNMEIRCTQKEKNCRYATFFFINVMVTTHKNTESKIHHKKRGIRRKKYGIPPNKNNGQKHKGKEPMEAQSSQKIKD